MPSTKLITTRAAVVGGSPLKPTAPSAINRSSKAHQLVKADSDEENIQPLSVSATSKSQAAKAKAMEDPSSNRPLSPHLPCGGSNKDKERDVRAYEHERQRVKRAGELAKRKARKAAPFGDGAIGHIGMGRKARGRAAGGAGVDVDVDVDVNVVGRVGIRHGKSLSIGLGSGRGGELSGNRGSSVAVMTEEALGKQGEEGGGGGIQVNMSDLVVHSQRKPRTLKEDDFELIPFVRSVIVLDDMTETRDMNLDEPWEHVDGDFEGINALAQVNRNAGDKEAEPSYAAVVLGAGH